MRETGVGGFRSIKSMKFSAAPELETAPRSTETAAACSPRVRVRGGVPVEVELRPVGLVDADSRQPAMSKKSGRFSSFTEDAGQRDGIRRRERDGGVAPVMPPRSQLTGFPVDVIVNAGLGRFAGHGEGPAQAAFQASLEGDVELRALEAQGGLGQLEPKLERAADDVAGRDGMVRILASGAIGRWKSSVSRAWARKRRRRASASRAAGWPRPLSAFSFGLSLRLRRSRCRRALG